MKFGCRSCSCLSPFFVCMRKHYFIGNKKCPLLHDTLKEDVPHGDPRPSVGDRKTLESVCIVLGCDVTAEKTRGYAR